MKNKYVIVLGVMIGLGIISGTLAYSVQYQGETVLPVNSREWKGENINVSFTTDPVYPVNGDFVKVGVKFTNPETLKIQEHIDYKIFITHEYDGLVLEALSHSGLGIITVPLNDVQPGVYVVSVEVIGILFQPIEKERMFTHIIVE